MSVRLVLVSHSARLAEGLAELAGQMAPEVSITAVGGADGGLGTSFDDVFAALDGPGPVVVLYDLGSARMTAELAVESLDDPSTAAVVDAPFVEGAVAAAVAAQGGGSLSAVVAAAAGGDQNAAAAGGEAAGPGTAASTVDGAEHRYQGVLRNELGLHARPAAALARAVGALDAAVTVAKGDHAVNAASVLALLSLDARGGDTLDVTAHGPDAARAVELLRELVESGFGE